MKLLFVIILMGSGSANAATGYSDYVSCFSKLNLSPLGFVLKDQSNVLVFEGEVFSNKKMVRGYYVYTQDACYPIPQPAKDEPPSKAYYELPVEKYFVYDTVSLGVKEPIFFAEDKIPEGITPKKLADGDIIARTRGVSKLSWNFRKHTSKLLERYESEKPLVEKDPYDDYVSALKICAGVDDADLAQSAKLTLEKFEASRKKSKKTPPPPKPKETNGNESS